MGCASNVGAPVPLHEIACEGNLALGSGGEVRVAGLRGGRHESPVDIVKERLAQAGAGRDEADVAAAKRFSFLEHMCFGLAQRGHRMRERFQIVQKRDA